MPIPNLQYEEDLTGTNPNNRITDMPINRPVTVGQPRRVVVLSKGPFFKNGAVLKSVNGAVQTVLTYGVDYNFVEPSPTLWRLTGGKDLFHGIVIKNNNLPSTFLFSCNLIGGVYHTDNETVATALESILNNPNSSPVDWALQVLNKPLVYNTGPHTQPLESVYAFGSLVKALERVGDAIAINNTPAFDNLYQYIKDQLDAVMAGGAGDVPAHNLSPLAHNDIRNDLEDLRAITNKVVATPITLNVRAVPGPGEFGTLKACSLYVNALMVKASITIRLNDAAMDEVEPITFSDVKRDNLQIFAGDGIFSTNCIITCTPTRCEDIALRFINCEGVIGGFTVVGVSPKTVEYSPTDPNAFYHAQVISVDSKSNMSFGRYEDAGNILNSTHFPIRTLNGVHGVVITNRSVAWGNRVSCTNFTYSGLVTTNGSHCFIDYVHSVGLLKTPVNVSDTNIPVLEHYRYVYRDETDITRCSVLKHRSVANGIGQYASSFTGIEVGSSSRLLARALIIANVESGVAAVNNSSVNIKASQSTPESVLSAHNIVSNISARGRAFVAWNKSKVYFHTNDSAITSRPAATAAVNKNSIEVPGNAYVCWADHDSFISLIGRWVIGRTTQYQIQASSNILPAVLVYNNTSTVQVSLASDLSANGDHKDNVTIKGPNGSIATTDASSFKRVNDSYNLYRSPGNKGIYNFLSSMTQIGPWYDRAADDIFNFADASRFQIDTESTGAFSRTRLLNDLTYESWGVFYTTGNPETFAINFEFAFPNRVTSISNINYVPSAGQWAIDQYPNNDEGFTAVSTSGFNFTVSAINHGIRLIAWKATGY